MMGGRTAAPVPDPWLEPVGPYLDRLRILGRSDATITNYRAALNTAARFFAGRACFGWQDITPTHAQSLAGYLLRSGYARNSMVAIGVAVRGLLRHLGRHAAADGATIRPGAYTRKRQPYRLEPGHVAAMLDAAPDPLQRALLAVLYGGGLRLSEALALTLAQGRELAAHGQGIITGKGKAERLCIIGRPAAADLAAAVRAAGFPAVLA
jgi:site-specific recombinase XerC